MDDIREVISLLNNNYDVFFEYKIDDNIVNIYGCFEGFKDEYDYIGWIDVCGINLQNATDIDFSVPDLNNIVTIVNLLKNNSK